MLRSDFADMYTDVDVQKDTGALEEDSADPRSDAAAQVRRMYVGRSSFSMAHYLHASRIQWVFRHHLIQLWRCKPAAAHTIAERAAESKQLMMRRKLKEADKRSEKNLKRMQGGDHRWAGSLQLDQGRGHGKEGKLLPSGAFVRSGITSAFDVVQVSLRRQADSARWMVCLLVAWSLIR